MRRIYTDEERKQRAAESAAAWYKRMKQDPEWVEARKKRQTEAARERRAANRLAFNKKMREYYHEHKETIKKKHADYREANRDIIRAKQRMWYATNKEWRDKHNEQVRKSRARKKINKTLDTLQVKLKQQQQDMAAKLADFNKLFENWE